MISYLVTTHNEGKCIYTLLDQITSFMDDDDEIVIVDDNSDDRETLAIIEEFEMKHNVYVFKHDLNKDFASHKNFGKEQCNNKWIFQIDADETVSGIAAGTDTRTHHHADGGKFSCCNGRIADLTNRRPELEPSLSR